MADFYFKVYLDVIVSVPNIIGNDNDDDDNCSHAYDKLEKALKLMDETEGIILEDVEII